MKHSIEVKPDEPYSQAMSQAIETCVHCGFCLPACPTYVELGQEADSPRGRILLMKQVLENDLEPAEISEHVDQCLGCLACETACPSGVKYRDLISPYRATHNNSPKKSFWERVRDKIVSMTIPFPGRFRWAIRLGRLTKFLMFLAPKAMKPMADMIPDHLPARVALDPVYPTDLEEMARVILLAGCAQQVLAPGINLDTIRLLNFCGATVEVPPAQSCCGALSWHNGNARQAQDLAQKNFAPFLNDAEWIVTNAAGCGSGMQEYDVLFEGTEQRERASKVADKVVDVSVLLSKLGFAEKVKSLTESVKPIKVAYHDACHLSNGQNVRNEPRQLIRSLPQVELCELPGPEICCGSAGTYNIEQPEIAGNLGTKKAKAVIGTDADILVTGNIGCIVQIQNHLKSLGSSIRVMHLVEFLVERLGISK